MSSHRLSVLLVPALALLFTAPAAAEDPKKDKFADLIGKPAPRSPRASP